MTHLVSLPPDLVADTHKTYNRINNLINITNSILGTAADDSTAFAKEATVLHPSERGIATVATCR